MPHDIISFNVITNTLFTLLQKTRAIRHTRISSSLYEDEACVDRQPLQNACAVFSCESGTVSFVHILITR